jgi:hypothetical protein
MQILYCKKDCVHVNGALFHLGAKSVNNMKEQEWVKKKKNSFITIFILKINNVNI